MSSGLKLAIGAGGIYASFLTYGKLHEQIFKFESSSGEKFKFAFFVLAVECVFNVLFAFVPLLMSGFQKNLKISLFIPAGISQVLAKACTSLALANSLSFPVVTLAKSGKMVPVMLGSIVLAGKRYSLKEYLTVGAIIAGTVIVTMSSKKSGKPDKEDSILGVVFIMASLAFDGVVGGMQSDIQKDTLERTGGKLKPWDMMFFTNLFMGITATIIAFVPFRDTSFTPTTPEFFLGLNYCLENQEILEKILYFGLASAIGQSFIFYTISNFDSLTTTTVTTTRKIMSTLLSIFTEGHELNSTGWFGIAVASGGISMEIINKMGGEKTKDTEKNK